MFTPSPALAYVLIVSAAVMFGAQFLFQQKYTNLEGTSVVGALKFSFFGSLIQIPLALLLSLTAGGLRGVSVRAFCLCSVTAVNLILNAYFSVRVFEKADMTLFSIFEMLGGMALPFVAGMAFFNEEVKLVRFIAFALITVALVLETGKTSPVKGKAWLLYAGLFTTNGLVGVCATVNARYIGASTYAYVFMCAVCVVAIAGTALLVNRFALRRSLAFAGAGKAFGAIVPYIIVATLGNVLVLTALNTLPASVQYPMSTGGTIVVSAIISTLRREKLTAKNYVAAAIAVVSAIIIAL